MKCPMCESFEGIGKIPRKRKGTAADFDMVECPQCHGAGEVKVELISIPDFVKAVLPKDILERETLYLTLQKSLEVVRNNDFLWAAQLCEELADDLYSSKYRNEVLKDHWPYRKCHSHDDYAGGHLELAAAKIRKGAKE